jgi:uncharacterized phage protein (TIGR02216 family)
LSETRAGLDAGLAPFPWNEAIGFGLGVLRLSPEAFWTMSVRELALAIEAVRGPRIVPFARADFAALMRRFPDAGNATDEG